MKRWVIILFLIAMVLLLAIAQYGSDYGTEKRKIPPVKLKTEERPPLQNLATKTNISPDLAPVDMQRFYHLRMPEEESLYDKLLSMVDRESLEKYEGSYARDDFTSQGDGSYSFNLSSSWLLSNSNLPTAGLRMRLNPQTKEYEVVGGELYLPKSGVGISHETDELHGETKTYLNLKKTF